MALPTLMDGTWVNPNSVSLDAGELRRADASGFAGNGALISAGVPVGATGGIVRHSTLSCLVSVDGSDVVTVKAGSVVIPGNAAGGTGVYRFGIAADVTGNLSARHASQTRIDLAVWRALDTDVVSGHGAYTGKIEILPGTPGAGAPVALPTLATELGRITVPPVGGPAASVDLTYRSFASSLGASLLVPTSPRLPSSALPFQRAQAADTGVHYTWDGTTWVPDFVDFAPAPLGSGFGGTVNFMRRSGWVSAVVETSYSGTIPNGATIATLPAGFRPSRAHYAPMQSGGPFVLVIANTNGTITMGAAGSGGVYGTLVFPVA